ncbi:MAG TPA: hypothetical protein VJH95_02320 [Candidatus Nanoarchaeia archaeon]|nr:hypothetical protein [Candidatus Nanoarchaeia archaeon]
MKALQISVKNVEEGIFNEFKAESVREGITIGKSLTLAMKLWLERTQKPKLSILDFKPGNWGKGTAKTSEAIDNILY